MNATARAELRTTINRCNLETSDEMYSGQKVCDKTLLKCNEFMNLEPVELVPKKKCNMVIPVSSKNQVNRYIQY